MKYKNCLNEIVTQSRMLPSTSKATVDFVYFTVQQKKLLSKFSVLKFGHLILWPQSKN